MCNILIEKDDNNLVLKFGSSEDILINTSKDIDLTDFVKRLSVFIDKDKVLDLNKMTFDDPKLELIQDTLVEIIDVYNEIISSKSYEE